MLKENKKGPHQAIENYLCFALYSASRTMSQLYGKYIDKLELTYPQLLVLMLLWEENQLTVNDICNGLLLDSGTVTPLLKRLEQKGYLTRSRSKKDERVVNVSISKEGMKVKQVLKNLGADMLCDMEMSVQEVMALSKKIHTVREKISSRI